VTTSYLYCTLIPPLLFYFLPFDFYRFLLDQFHIMDRRLVQLFSIFLAWVTNRQFQTFAFAHQGRPRVFSSSTHSKVKQPLRQQSVRFALQTRGGDDSTRIEDARPPAQNALVVSFLSLGKQYSIALEKAPILTKSCTAGVIFVLSDYLAQRLEKKEGSKLDTTRLFTSAAVGLFCFGPGAHYWYNMIFRVFPGTSLISTVQKAAMGQLFFGPSFTCVFFAASLLQTGQFSVSNWLRKIRTDLPGTWVSGLCFWPLVDLVSYSVISKEFIPLFVNICSLVWTIYLSTVANRAARTD